MLETLIFSSLNISEFCDSERKLLMLSVQQRTKWGWLNMNSIKLSIWREHLTDRKRVAKWHRSPEGYIEIKQEEGSRDAFLLGL